MTTQLMDVNGATALVTGTNRGLERSFALELLGRGAKVYATARRPELVDIPGATVVRVDIVDEASVAEAAEVASDVDLLINNAALTASPISSTGTSVSSADSWSPTTSAPSA